MFYKVTTRNKRSINDFICLKYKVKEWTYPNIGKLFVFKSLKYAKRFAYCSYCIIWKCEVKNPVRIRGKILVKIRNAKDIEDFWVGKKGGEKSQVKGSYFCDAVRIIERV